MTTRKILIKKIEIYILFLCIDFKKMIYEKKLLNTLLKYDTDEEKLFRFHKAFKRWTVIDPDISYNESKDKFVYNEILIDKKQFYIHRLIYFVCHDDFDIFDSNVTIDHINVNHLDNRLENLRKATMAEQARNKLNYGGKLISGFTIHNDGRKKKYRGYYNKDGKQFTKCFLSKSEAKAFHDNNFVRF
jgi:hypothetical protein